MAKLKFKEKAKVNKDGWRTSTSERVKYYVGDLGRTCEGSLVTVFMTMFLLMQGIDPAKMAGVTLIVKIIDSFDDVIFGHLVDKIKLKIGGNGKYLPWYRATFLLFPIFTVLFFLMPSGWSENAKLVWFGVFYLLYDLAYTMVEVPMNSMAVTLTDNIAERNHIIQNRGIFSQNIIMVIGVVFYALVSEAIGFPIKYVVLGSSIIFIAMMAPLAKGVKEHNAELNNVDEEEKAHYSLRDMFECVKTNKYMFVILLSSLVTSCLATGANLANFVSYYHFGNSMVFAIPIAIAAVPGLIAQLNTARLTEKFGKKAVVLVGGIAGGLLMSGIYFVGTKQIALLCTLVCLQALPGNVSNIAKTFLIPDTIEYTRYKTGKDCSGIFYAMNSFVTKLTQGVASSLALFILGFSGWVEITATDFADIAAQNVQQPESALNCLWLLYAFVPALGTLLGVLTMFLYKLKDKDAALMAKCNAGEITREECEAQLSRKY